MRTTSRHPARRPHRTRGFTLIELMITLTVLAVVMIILSTVMYTAARNKTATANRIESSQAGRVAVDLIARDLRSAGYGCDLDPWGVFPTQPPIAYVDSTQVLVCENLMPFPDTTGNGHAAPLAYDPSANPKPYPLTLSGYAPPGRYRTGAELIRWTLDVNNDGVIDASDLSAPAGVDAQRTPNPNDYVLVREIYGDSTGNVAHSNGGNQERIALVRKPASGGVPAMFTVYMRGQTTPWSWANGAVPPSQLRDIERVVVNVVATSGKADYKGNFAQTVYSTQVNSLRNVPLSLNTTTVDGFVFEDQNTNHVKDGLDVGIPGVTVRLGNLSAVTNSAGYYVFGAAPGTYAVRQVVPPGYANFTFPDSFVVTVPPAGSASFADTRLQGGYVTAHVFDDVNKDGVFNTGDTYRANVQVTVNPGANVGYTNTSGVDSLFASTGAYTMAITVPDSFICATPNPASGTMVDNGRADLWFAIQRAPTAIVQGRVWHDKNNNGSQGVGEPGIEGVWVGIVSSTTSSVLGYGYSNVSGDYTITVPANSPPGTDPYTIECIPANGYYPSTSSSINNVMLTGGQVLTGQNFGLNAFQQIVLTASRVLSLGSGDAIEKDWTGNATQKAHKDQDLFLGADANGTDQVSVWFNKYDSTPLFNSTRDYSRSAPNAVMSMSVDTLSIDPDPFPNRVDLVTGTKYSVTGNLFTWFNQNTSGNEGYLPTTYSQSYTTTDNGDVQAVVTGNVTGGSGVDIIAGTKSPSAGTGTIELWRSNDAATPTYSRVEVYPTVGTLGYPMGEVTSLVLTKLRSTGQDLIVGTHQSDYQGQIMVFSKTDSGSVFTLRWIQQYSSSSVQAISVGDITGDGKPDIIVALQRSSATGRIELWRNDTVGNLIALNRIAANNFTGVPTAMVAGDFGGAAGKDVAVGFRSDMSSYGGGVKIFYCDSGTLPVASTDPSGGAVVNFVPAMTTGNYNYGVEPSLPSPPYLLDIAAGVKSGATSGALVIFIR